MLFSPYTKSTEQEMCKGTHVIFVAMNQYVHVIWTHFVFNKADGKPLLLKRSITVNSSCPICNNPCEDSAHVLRYCPHAVFLWQNLDIPTSIGWTPDLEFTSWLKKGCLSKHTSPFYGIPQGTFIAFACWNLWIARNKAIFEPFSSSSLLHNILAMVAEYSLGPIQQLAPLESKCLLTALLKNQH